MLIYKSEQHIVIQLEAEILRDITELSKAAGPGRVDYIHFKFIYTAPFTIRIVSRDFTEVYTDERHLPHVFMYNLWTFKIFYGHLSQRTLSSIIVLFYNKPPDMMTS